MGLSLRSRAHRNTRMTHGFNFALENAEDAWYRIFLSLLFGWILFAIGLALDLANVTILSTMFFIFVGILAYIIADSLIYLMTHGDNNMLEHRHLIVGTVFALLLNLVVFYGALAFASF